MAAPAPDPAVLSLQQTAALLRAQAFRWRVGAEVSPGLSGLREELTARMKLDVEAIARGEVPVAPAVRIVATRALALLSCAPLIDEACERWSRMRAEVLHEPLDVFQARSQALRDPSSIRARELWLAARNAMRPLAGGDVASASEALTRALPGPRADDARGFLDATRDLFDDAQDFARRRHRAWADVPETLLTAQVHHHALPDESVPTAASRHLARALVEHLARPLPSLRRVSLRPMVAVSGFASVGDDGGPRVAWHERRGVAAMVELCMLTVESVVLALQPAAASSCARLLVLGLLAPPVLRKLLGIGKEDAARVRRQCATWLLREARIAAVLAERRPAVPDDAMDALQAATRSDPDVADAVAACAPWPQPGPALGPLAVEHEHAWRSWVLAGTLVGRLRDGWDEDFAVRGTFHQTLLQVLQSPHGDDVDWSVRLGAPQAPTWTALRHWIEEVLA